MEKFPLRQRWSDGDFKGINWYIQHIIDKPSFAEFNTILLSSFSSEFKTAENVDKLCKAVKSNSRGGCWPWLQVTGQHIYLNQNIKIVLCLTKLIFLSFRWERVLDGEDLYLDIGQGVPKMTMVGSEYYASWNLVNFKFPPKRMHVRLLSWQFGERRWWRNLAMDWGCWGLLPGTKQQRIRKCINSLTELWKFQPKTMDWGFWGLLHGTKQRIRQHIKTESWKWDLLSCSYFFYHDNWFPNSLDQ